MAKKKDIKTVEHLSIREKVVADMTSLGTYKEEYDTIIEIYADLLTQYYKANEMFRASGFQYETETAAGGTKKSAIVATLENLRKDILAYSDRLSLTPKSVESVTKDSPKKSKLASVLDGLK